MNKLSDYLSKPVISLHEANLEGTVISALFSRKLKKLLKYVLLVEGEKEDSDMMLPLKSVMRGEGAVLIKNSTKLIAPEFDPRLTVKSPINAQVYDTDGVFLGTLKDVLYDEKGYTTEILVSDKTYKQTDIMSANDSLVILRGKNYVKPTRAPRKPKASEESEAVKKPAGSSTPVRIISDYTFLLYRTVLRDILNNEGDIIIKKDTRITQKTVELARKYGKLVELTVSSK